MSKVKDKILSVLKADARLWNEETTELNQTKLLDLVESIDEVVINLLLSEEELREEFFVKIKDVYVFDTNGFRFFMEENKIDNSYTAYKNRIGLTDGKKFLKYSSDVVLDFPFKDCILEGGQSTEEGTDTYFEYSNKSEQYEQKETKRKEIFFNQVLAKDEIDRLLDPKTLVNWKRITKNGEEEIGIIERDDNGMIRENLIIKGNNLLALHSLHRSFSRKVKLIYIDPPYNTEGAANTFVYNNSFNHSSWLTFVKNRAEIALGLLKSDGFFALAIDHVELFYVGVLLDEIFGAENRVGVIAVETNPRGRSDSKFFATSHEYLLVYAYDSKVAVINNLPLTKEQEKNFSLGDETSTYRLLPFRRSGSNSTPKERPNLFYPIYFEPNTRTISLEKDAGYDEIYPIDTSGGNRVWRQSKKACIKAIENGDLVIREGKGGNYSVYLKDRIKDGRKPKSFWSNPRYDASSHGTILLKNMLGEKLFSYPKSIYLMKDVLHILTSPEDIVLDYHAGSGTTAHAVLDLNKHDGGTRKFILIEQMDYINTVTCPRIKNVMAKDNINDSFVYFELAKWNETAKKKILEAKTLEELEAFFEEMYEKYFLNYNLNTKEFREKVIKEEQFQNLTLDEQKQIFVAMLDNNQMYVNKTEMADKKFGISEVDQKLTDAFYNEKK